MPPVDLSKMRSLVEPILGLLGYELVDLKFVAEHGRHLLRMMIDKEGGVTVGDCQTVSREIETLLEVEEVIHLHYDLEVSSPGLDRPLTREADFIRFAGETVSLKTREPIEGRRNYKGLLKEIEDKCVVMVIDGKEFKIPLGAIEKARLCYKI